MKLTLNQQFWLAISLGFILLMIGPIWAHKNFCSLHGGQAVKTQSHASGNSSEPQQAQNIVIYPGATYSSAPSSAAKQEGAERGERVEHPWLCGAEITDIAIAFFTYCLIVVGWVTMKSNEETMRNVESAQLAFHWNANMINGRLNASIGVRNGGKTPAHLEEWYIGLLEKEPLDRRPTYPRDIPHRKGKTGLFIPTQTDSNAGPNIATLWIDPAVTPYVIAYFRYRDTFKRPHLSRMCIYIGDPFQGWAPAGPEAWNEDD